MSRSFLGLSVAVALALGSVFAQSAGADDDCCPRIKKCKRSRSNCCYVTVSSCAPACASACSPACGSTALAPAPQPEPLAATNGLTASTACAPITTCCAPITTCCAPATSRCATISTCCAPASSACGFQTTPFQGGAHGAPSGAPQVAPPPPAEKGAAPSPRA